MRGLRHPEQDVLDTTAGQVKRLARSGNVGEHHAGAGAEKIDHLLLNRLRRMAKEVEQAEKDHGFGRLLDLSHLAAYRGEPFQRGVQPHGQRGEDEPKIVAQFGRLARVAQVDGNDRTQGKSRYVHALCLQIVAQRTGYDAHQDIVDLGVVGLGNEANFVEGQRVRPGDPLLNAKWPLERRVGIGRIAQHARHDCSAVCGDVGALDQARRMQERLLALVQQEAGGLLCESVSAPHRACQQTEDASLSL